MNLTGRTALVTGGATGIGSAIVRRLAAEGVAVVIADINEGDGRAVEAEVGGRFVRCDVQRGEDTKAAVSYVVTEFGSVDILVTSAAHTGGFHSASEMPEEEWRSVIDVSLTGVFLSAKYAAAAMKTQGKGSIIHIASVEGMTGAANHAAYVTAKTATYGLTRSMAIDYGRYGIRVNAISPGIIDSGRPDLEEGKADSERMAFWRSMTVLDRMGRPEEIASVAAFLASDEASYITGQNIAVDGGWTIGYPMSSLSE